MRIAKVVGNVVSTIKEETHYNKKMMIIEYLDLELKPVGERCIALDAVDSGIGDIVLTSKDGGAAKMLFEDKTLISDVTICGVIDHFTVEGNVVKTT